MTNDSLIALIESAETNIHNAASGSMSDIESWLDCARDDLNKAKAAIAAMGVTGVQSEASPNRVENASQDQFNSDAPANGRFVNQGDEFARVTMEALDQNITQSEIPYNELKEMLFNIMNTYTVNNNAGKERCKKKSDAIFDLFKPYLQPPEPVPVSLEKCAKAIHDERRRQGLVSYTFEEVVENIGLEETQCFRQAKVVLDAAGVKYVE